MRGLGRGTEGELVHVRLAQADAAGIERLGDAGGRERAHVGLEHARGAGRVRAHEVHVVLEGDGDTCQDADGFSRGNRRVDGIGLLVGKLGRELEEGVHLGLEGIDELEG